MTNELVSYHLEWTKAHRIEVLHPSRTVEDHYPQLHLSIDERLDFSWMMRPDVKMRW
jgi:hypothetical protein